MRRAVGARLALTAVAIGAASLTIAACGAAAPTTAVARSTGERAAGRAYDGAPPTIPHDAAIGSCLTCHDGDGTAIDGIGVAPASPHGADAATGAFARCRQCHVPVVVRRSFVASRFTGIPQGPWRGSRATPGAPPRIPHTLQLRGDCLSCHSGPGARAELRTSHPDRVRCRQCHVPEPGR